MRSEWSGFSEGASEQEAAQERVNESGWADPESVGYQIYLQEQARMKELETLGELLEKEKTTDDLLSAEDFNDLYANTNQDVEGAARAALGEMIAEPFTDLVVRGVSLLGVGTENVAAGEGIDDLSRVLTAIADPAQIPSEVARAVVDHLATHLLAPALGPIGLVAVIFAGDFAGELTYQALDGDRAPEIQRAVNAIDLTGAFADAQLGRLAESEPFRDYIGNLAGESIAEILPGGEEGHESATTATVAVYEVRSPAVDSEVVQVRPAWFAVWTCIRASDIGRGTLITST